MVDRRCCLGVSAFVITLGALACSPEVQPPAEGQDAAVTCGSPNLLVVSSDEQSVSELGVVSTDGAAQFYGSPDLGHDPVVASSNGRVFWIDRSSGQVLELDPHCGNVIAGPWDTSDPAVSGSTNPQDIAVSPTTGDLWIARFAVPTLLVKSSDGSTDLARIDLSSVAGVNRNPDMSSIRIIDGKAYVALEMLDAEDQPNDPAYVVKIDVATRKIEGTLELKGRNPFGLMVEDDVDGALFIAEPGNWYDATETDAGIERVDLATFTSTLVVRESDIGASVDELAIAGGCGVAIVAGPTAENLTSLITFDPASGAIVTPLSDQLLFTAAGFKLGGVTWLPGGLAAVGDATAHAGQGYPIHFLAASSCALRPTAETPYAPLPPIQLLPTP
jgi:hypothetical protein